MKSSGWGPAVLSLSCSSQPTSCLREVYVSAFQHLPKPIECHMLGARNKVSCRTFTDLILWKAPIIVLTKRVPPGMGTRHAVCDATCDKLQLKTTTWFANSASFSETWSSLVLVAQCFPLLAFRHGTLAMFCFAFPEQAQTGQLGLHCLQCPVWGPTHSCFGAQGTTHSRGS